MQQADTLLNLLFNYIRCTICINHVCGGVIYRHLFLVLHHPLTVKSCNK